MLACAPGGAWKTADAASPMCVISTDGRQPAHQRPRRVRHRGHCGLPAQALRQHHAAGPGPPLSVKPIGNSLLCWIASGLLALWHVGHGAQHWRMHLRLAVLFARTSLGSTVLQLHMPYRLVKTTCIAMSCGACRIRVKTPGQVYTR